MLYLAVPEGGTQGCVCMWVCEQDVAIEERAVSSLCCCLIKDGSGLSSSLMKKQSDTAFHLQARDTKRARRL